ncbi:MAG: ATP-binding protein [Planctomycetaceae bacterium]
MTFSRINTRGKKLVPIRAAAAFEVAVDHLQVTIQDNEAIIKCEPLPVVSAEMSQLVMLFQNLIHNAIKYRSERRTEIQVSVREIPDAYEFCVKDNGIGIEEDYYSKIFEIFKRLHSPHEYGGGTGIGLANAKRIVERFGGRIWVTSKPGQGSAFYFTLKQAEQD